MNRSLSHTEVQDFINENYDKDLPGIVFKGSPFHEVSTMELAEQLAGKKKAKKKLPTWFHSQGIIYPPKLNLEQTSSEITAKYKASLTGGKALADITGGFGVDSYYFSKQLNKVYHCEMNRPLSEIVAHNTAVLGALNIECVAGDGMNFLKGIPEKLDWVYLDPSRRTNSGGRVFHLSDCTPNVPEHLGFLFDKADNILLKTAPLLDLQAGMAQLEGVKEIHIIAVTNDVKELLWVLGKNYSGDIAIKTVNFNRDGTQAFEGLFNSRPNLSFGPPQNYLYEPNAAIMKSGLFESIGNYYRLTKLHQNTHLFTSNDLVDFPGRRFRILERLPYNRKKIKRRLGSTKANITTRNFPESVESLRRLYKLKDGGDVYLFFTTVAQEEKTLLVCEKIN